MERREGKKDTGYERGLRSERIDRGWCGCSTEGAHGGVSPGWSTRPDYAEPYWLY